MFVFVFRSVGFPLAPLYKGSNPTKHLEHLISLGKVLTFFLASLNLKWATIGHYIYFNRPDRRVDLCK